MLRALAGDSTMTRCLHSLEFSFTAEELKVLEDVRRDIFY